MARIEQIIPKLIPGQWEKSSSSHFIYRAGAQAFQFSIDEKWELLLKSMNGTYSLSEMARTLLGKGVLTSFSLFVDTVASFCDKGIFVNNDEIKAGLEYLLGGKKTTQEKSSLKTNDVDEKYFSTERLLPLLKRTVLNAKNDEEILKKIITASELLKVGPTNVLIKEGEVGSELFVLLTGLLGVYKDKENGSTIQINTIGPITVLGESSALLEKKRNASIIPLEPSWVLKVPTQKLINVNKEVNIADFDSVRTQILVNQILLMAPLFQGLSADSMQGVMRKCQLLSLPKASEVLCEEDSSNKSNINPQSFYFVLEGALSMSKKGSPIGNLVKGDYFGEVGGINKVQGSTTIETLTDCLFLVLEAKDLQEVLSKNFSLALQIEEFAEARSKTEFNDSSTLSSFHYDFDDESNEFTLTDIKYG